MTSKEKIIEKNGDCWVDEISIEQEVHEALEDSGNCTNCLTCECKRPGVVPDKPPNIWHDKTETPERFPVMALYDRNNYMVEIDFFDDFKYDAQFYNLQKWCYPDELLKATGVVE